MLLADFHIHTSWSDGRHSMNEVVDIFGRSGHDVIAITDHVVNRDSFLGKAAHRLKLSVTGDVFQAYRVEIERETKRAWDKYRMVVLAGCELTRNGFTGDRSAHALALGLDDFIPADGPVEEMLSRARDAGCVTVACHPHEQSGWFENTFYLWNRKESVKGLIDLWELACRWDLFPPVSRDGLSFIGNSDFHSRPHVWAWKTLLDCEKSPKAILSALRRGTGLGLTRLAAPERRPATPLFAPAPAEVESCGCFPSLARA